LTVPLRQQVRMLGVRYIVEYFVDYVGLATRVLRMPPASGWDCLTAIEFETLTQAVHAA
jgi:hypothetical protein